MVVCINLTLLLPSNIESRGIQWSSLLLDILESFRFLKLISIRFLNFTQSFIINMYNLICLLSKVNLFLDIIEGKSNALRKHAYSNILKILLPKNEHYRIKNSYNFHISAQNLDCGYSLEPPR